MQKNKRQNQGKAAASPEELDDTLAHTLSSLAVDLAAQGDRVSKDANEEVRKSDLERIIRKCLQQKKDEVLRDALERTYEEDSDAYVQLKECTEELSEVVVFRRDDGSEMEINAFVVPLFAHVSGGLHSDQCFQDEEAFGLLRDSFRQAQLESPDAHVVLVSHAYHLDEIERIGYSQLNDMVREAADTVLRKKFVAAPAIERSMSGWPDNDFAPGDMAVELRFLLGFALKKLDDSFYRVPKGEAAADRYFEARAERFRKWAQEVEPLVKRCLVTDGREVEIDFLYQDLFHGGKDRGLAEYLTLQMMSELHHGLEQHGLQPEQVHAVVGPVEDDMSLRVNLYARDGDALVASADKPMDLVRDLRAETDDACDALITIGVKSLAIAKSFDVDGQAVDVRPHRP